MTKRIIKETESAVPVNAMGPSSSSSGPINTYDPMLQNPGDSKKKKLRSMFTRNPLKDIKAK
jgi:hypothetical protein